MKRAAGIDSVNSGSGYRCYLLGSDGRVAQRVDLSAGDDVSAAVEAQAVLNGSQYGSAELWRLGRKILDLTAGNA